MFHCHTHVCGCEQVSLCQFFISQAKVQDKMMCACSDPPIVACGTLNVQTSKLDFSDSPAHPRTSSSWWTQGPLHCLQLTCVSHILISAPNGNSNQPALQSQQGPQHESAPTTEARQSHSAVPTQVSNSTQCTRVTESNSVSSNQLTSTLCVNH